MQNSFIFIMETASTSKDFSRLHETSKYEMYFRFSVSLSSSICKGLLVGVLLFSFMFTNILLVKIAFHNWVLSVLSSLVANLLP